MRLEGDELVLVRGRKEERLPLAGLGLVETGDGTMLWAPDFEARVRSYAYVAREVRRPQLSRLAWRAYGTRDERLARQVLELADADGYTGTQAQLLKQKVAKLSESSLPLLYPQREDVMKRLERIRWIHADLLVQRARKEPDETAALGLLREALRTEPASPATRDLLRERAPPSFPLGDGALWLDWRLEVETGGARIAPDGLPALEEARRLWRADLYAVRSGPILLLTPVRDMRCVGRCLAFGNLLCRTLEEMFATDEPTRRYADALRVFLYLGKEEYTSTSGTGRPIEDPGALEWTSGHYTPGEGISRTYWDRDVDAERRIVTTFVHELTHHWLEERNPRVPAGEREGEATLPGFWIVEGFATFLEEGQYDADAAAVELFDGRSRSLDVLASLAGGGKLLPWPRVYDLAQAGFAALARAPDHKVVRSWAMGVEPMSPAQLYYVQAAATCHYLYHAEGGRFRQRLLDYVVDWYSGDKERLDVRAAFGMDGDVLGAKVEEFARQVATGWRPEGDGNAAAPAGK